VPLLLSFGAGRLRMMPQARRHRLGQTGAVSSRTATSIPVAIRASAIFLNTHISLLEAASQSLIALSRSALAMTDTDDRLIAAAAIIGDRSVPRTGNRTPAATGIPSTL
jgi:hypothetical protein